MEEVFLEDFLDEFIVEFKTQLQKDRERWGKTWQYRSREGQEERIFQTLNDYYDKYRFAERPIHWLAVIGNAYIAWVRENHPEVLIERG